MDFENWYVPKAFNTEMWTLVSQSNDQLTVEKNMQLTNFKNYKFDVHVNRTIQLLNPVDVDSLLNIEVPEKLKQVAFESSNTITNVGDRKWTRKTGALSIWILSMFSPSPGVTVAIPYKEGPKEELGPILTTDYFGEINEERLSINDGMIYYYTDGKKRSKLGVGPRRAKSVAGYYDPNNQILTILQFSLPKNNNDYVNSLWKHQEHPYGGDVVNAYNDGPLEDGSQLGPFFELESSSPAAFLDSDQSMNHKHRIFHFKGNEQEMNNIAQKVLGVGLEKIKSAFNK